MSGKKTLRSLVAWLVICVMLVGTLASCDLSSLGLGGMMQNGNFVEDEDDRGSKDKNKRPSKDTETAVEDESEKEESTKRPNNWFDNNWGVESSIECETDRVEEIYDKHDGHDRWEECIEEERFSGYLDGEYTDRYVYVEFCNSCGEYIAKRINTYAYIDATERYITRYEWEFYNCDDFGSFIMAERDIEYYTLAQSPYMNGATYSYISKRVIFEYDDLGNEIGYLQSEYVYNGNGCNVTEKCSDSKGNSYKNNYEDYHPCYLETYTLKNGGSCLDGVEVTSLCPMCGYIDHRYDWDGGHAFSENGLGNEVAMFVDHGHSCNGNVWGMTCACGEETRLEYWFDAEHIRSYSRQLEGTEHYYDVYRCYGDCGQTFTIERYTYKDASCNAVIYTNFIFDDGYVVSGYEKESQYHNTYSEGLIGESSYVKHPDGSVTSTDAYLEKCADCGLAMEKRIKVCSKTREGLETYRSEIVYGFKNGNVNDSYIRYESVWEYGVSYNQYDSENLRNYPISYWHRNYDDNGNVTDFCEEYYTYIGNGHCTANVQRKSLGCEDEYYTTETHVDGVCEISLAPGANDCTDGINVRWFCGDCGKTLGYEVEYGNHRIDVDEKVDLGSLGAECAGSFVVKKCLCGEYTEYHFDTECYFEHVEGYGSDYSSDGLTDIEKNMYRCTVCGFTYVECHEYNYDASCVQTVTHSIIFGVSDIEDTGLYAVSYDYVSDHLVHNTEYYELNVGGRVVGEERCKVCGKLVSEQSKSDFTMTNTYYDYYKNGNVSSMYVEEYYVFYNDNDLYQIVTKRTYHESYNEFHEVKYWNEYIWEYSGDENNCFCGNYRVIFNCSELSEGYVCEEGERHEWYGLSYDLECVPGKYVVDAYCVYCGKERYSYDASHWGHAYKYDSRTGMYTCIRCGIMDYSDEYDRMMMSNLTDGQHSGCYVIRFYEGGIDDWQWKAYIVLPNGIEISIDQSYISFVDGRLMYIEAEAVANIASGYGYSSCNYMIKLEAINRYDGEACVAYIDGHLRYLESVTDHGCDGEYIETYGCMLCGSSGIYEKGEYRGHYYTEHVQVTISYDASGNRITRRVITYYCQSCGQYETYETVQTHTPWGECISRTDK